MQYCICTQWGAKDWDHIEKMGTFNFNVCVMKKKVIFNSKNLKSKHFCSHFRQIFILSIVWLIDLALLETTCLVFSRVIRDLHCVHLQPLRTFSDVVYSGDVGTFFIDHLHHLFIHIYTWWMQHGYQDCSFSTKPQNRVQTSHWTCFDVLLNLSVDPSDLENTCVAVNISPVSSLCSCDACNRDHPSVEHRSRLDN